MNHYDIVSHGLHVRIEVAVRGLITLIETRLPPAHSISGTATDPDRHYRIEPAESRDVVLSIDGDFALRSSNYDEVLEYFEADLDLFVAVNARGFVFVHAGVVGIGGRALVLPGQSFSGKTTLVAELVRAGATFYSDESAVLDAQGRVHGFHRPLRVRETNGNRSRVNPEAFGGSAGHQPLPVGRIVFARYERQAIWSPQSLTRGEAALGLLANTPCARTRPGEALACFATVCAQADAVESLRGEAELVAHDLIQSAQRP